MIRVENYRDTENVTLTTGQIRVYLRQIRIYEYLRIDAMLRIIKTLECPCPAAMKLQQGQVNRF